MTRTIYSFVSIGTFFFFFPLCIVNLYTCCLLLFIPSIHLFLVCLLICPSIKSTILCNRIWGRTIIGAFNGRLKELKFMPDHCLSNRFRCYVSYKKREKMHRTIKQTVWRTLIKVASIPKVLDTKQGEYIQFGLCIKLWREKYIDQVTNKMMN